MSGERHGNKKGSNKGILRARRARRREEAEARNALTLPERTRAYRRDMLSSANTTLTKKGGT